MGVAVFVQVCDVGSQIIQYVGTVESLAGIQFLGVVFITVEDAVDDDLLRGIGAVVTCLILVVAIGVKAIVQLGVRARLNGGRVGQLACLRINITRREGLDDVHDGASACRNRAGDYASTIIPASVAVAANQLCTLIGDLEGRTLVAGDGQLVHQGDAAVGGDGYRRAIIYRFIKRVHDNAVNLSVNRRSGHPLLGEAVDGGGGLARLGAIIGGRTNAIVQIGAFARRDGSGVGQLIVYNVVPVKGSDDIDGGGHCTLGNCAGDNSSRTGLLCVTVASHQSRALVGDGEVRARVAGDGQLVQQGYAAVFGNCYLVAVIHGHVRWKSNGARSRLTGDPRLGKVVDNFVGLRRLALYSIGNWNRRVYHPAVGLIF